MVPSLASVIALLERRYPPELAQSWDAVGLVCGDPSRMVDRVLFAVDPTEAIASEAAEVGADLIVTHHPLFLSGVHSVAATTPGGRLVHRLIEEGRALYAAHTNADSARPGVSDALADALGVIQTRPLDPWPEDPSIGLGRIGRLAEPMSLARFVDRVAQALPQTAQGVRAAGDPDAWIEVVAVCGGSGESLATQADAAGADVYVTADCKHHRTLDHRAGGGCAIVDVAHWASEWLWLPQAAAALRDDAAAQGATVDVVVSSRVTDPWTLHVRSGS